MIFHLAQHQPQGRHWNHSRQLRESQQRVNAADSTEILLSKDLSEDGIVLSEDSIMLAQSWPVLSQKSEISDKFLELCFPVTNQSESLESCIKKYFKPEKIPDVTCRTCEMKAPVTRFSSSRQSLLQT